MGIESLQVIHVGDKPRATVLDCGHAPSTAHTYNGAPAWQFVIDWDGKRRICHACADARVLDCGHTPSSHEPFTTGYGEDTDGRRYCYACCAERERASMALTGRATLYLTRDAAGEWSVTDWAGKLRFIPFRVRVSRHGGGFGSQRTDAWFTGPDGATWHGVNRGDMQIIRCRRIKARC